MSGLDTFLTVLTVLSTVCAILFGYAAFRARRKKDDTDAGRDRGVLLSEVGYIKAGVDELKQAHRDTAAKLSDVNQRLTRVEESVKQAHKRIDEQLRLKKSDAV